MVFILEARTITKKGQVTIPLPMRRALGINEGEKVILSLKGGGIYLRKGISDPVEAMVGMGKGIFGKSVKYQRKIRDEWDA